MSTIAIKATTPTATPTPMPALAPFVRSDEFEGDCGDGDVGVEEEDDVVVVTALEEVVLALLLVVELVLDIDELVVVALLDIVDRSLGAGAWNVSLVGSAQETPPLLSTPQQCQRSVVAL